LVLPAFTFPRIFDLLEIAGPTLDALALFALGDVLDLAVLEKRLHRNFSTAGAEKFLRRAGRTAVLTGLSHIPSPCPL